ILARAGRVPRVAVPHHPQPPAVVRSEEHTSELQSLAYLVCRLLLEKKKVWHNSRRGAGSRHALRATQPFSAFASPSRRSASRIFAAPIRLPQTPYFFF